MGEKKRKLALVSGGTRTMKLDVRTMLKDVRDGSVLFDMRPDGKRIDMSFQHTAAEALGSMTEDEARKNAITQEMKMKRGKLIEKLFKRPEGEFSIEEIAHMKERIGIFYGPIVVIAVENFLNPQAEETPVEAPKEG